MDWRQLWEICSAPDNVPIVGLIPLLAFYIYLAIKQAKANDQLIEQLEADPAMAKTAAQLDREISHALVRGPGKRWVHRTVAQEFDVPEDVVRRIYAAVQTAKKQGLRGGYAVDLAERMVGRRLIGGEYGVESREAREGASPVRPRRRLPGPRAAR